MSEIGHFVVCSSVLGSAHRATGAPCQDASQIVFSGYNYDTAVLALSDGAGSAKHAEDGARIIVDSVIDHFAALFQDHPCPNEMIQEFDASDVAELLAGIRKQIEAEAGFLGIDIREFAATLLGAVVHPKVSFFFQIGDGCWVYQKENNLTSATWPQQGEYASQTVFATCRDATDHIQTHLTAGKVDFAVGITDGLERLALDFSAGVPSPKFFVPLLRSLHQLTEYDAMLSVEKWLASDTVCNRTNDDKTLVAIVLNGSNLQ